MKFKLFILALSLMISANTLWALPFKADAKTKRIPAGTKLRLELIDPLTTNSGQEGDYFSAMLLEDQKSQESVILPAGSVVRGSVNKIVPIKRLSKGAVLYIDFDHVVTPNGRQLPMAMGICNRADLTIDGGIFGSRGYGEAIKQNWVQTVDITKKATQFGVKAGENSFNGAIYLTAPICAVGGAFGGGAFFVGDSVADLFRKGKNVILNQGTILDVMLTYPIDVPVN
jgi:hypothetical protein